MSKLSELIPAGGSAKELSAVASGTLPNGRAVILNSNGTVSLVAEVAASLGTVATTTAGYDGLSVSMLSDTTFVAVGADSSNGASAWVGTVSNGTITFGSPTVWSTTTEASNVIGISNTQFVIVYKDYGNSNRGKAAVGTISGTSISFGTIATFETGQTNLNSVNPITALSSTKVVIVYEDASNSSAATAIVGTVSGTSISFGSATVFNSANSSKYSIVDKLNSTSVIIGYSETPSSTRGRALVGTISGTSISFGSQVTYAAGPVVRHTVSALTETKFVISYQDNGASKVGKSIVGTISGTTITLGSPVSFYATTLDNQFFSSTRTLDTEFSISFRTPANSNYGALIFGTVSGTSISFGASTVFQSSTIGSPIYSTLLGASDLITGFDATLLSAVDYTLVSTNLTSTNFVGFASEAISSGATGVINPVGGVAASVSNLAPASVGTPVTVNAASSSYFSAVFDSENNKIVIAYKDGGNSNYGTAIVGTVSGSSISYGSPVVFRSASSNYNSVAFDSNSNKVVVAYEDQGGTINGNSNVGTVSGTSISFGSVSEFYSARPQHVCSVFDSNSNKIVIAYSDIANSYYGTAIIGTVSGTTISYGSPVIFETSRVYDMTIAFDDNANKVVISYRDIGNSNYGTAIVGTVSGTSISFGTAVIFKASATSRTSTVYDSTANKIVLAYCDETNSFYGTAIVGTVSGTSISFGSAVVWNSSDFADVSTVFNADNNKVILSYKINGGSGGGKVIEGTVSGNSISFSSPLLFDQQANSQLASAFDSNSNKVLIAYKESIASHGKSVVYTSGISAFTIGSTYYVQSDGTVSTVSTSPAVNAGKAISATSLLLKG